MVRGEGEDAGHWGMGARPLEGTHEDQGERMGVDARVRFEGGTEEEEPQVARVGGETAGMGSGPCCHAPQRPQGPHRRGRRGQHPKGPQRIAGPLVCIGPRKVMPVLFLLFPAAGESSHEGMGRGRDGRNSPPFLALASMW